MAVTKIENTDLMVLQRPSDYDSSDTDAGTYSFTLGQLSEYVMQTGVTCSYRLSHPSISVNGDLWYDTKNEQLFVRNDVDADTHTWDAVANSTKLQAEYDAKMVDHDQQLADIDAHQITQDNRLDDHDIEIGLVNDELDRHNNRLVALEGAAIKAVYVIPATIGADPGEGEIYILKADGTLVSDYNDGVKFKINITDQNSKSPNILTFTQNDIIRVNGVNTIGATFKITNIVATQTPPVYEYDVECIGNFSAVVTDTEIEVDFLKSFDPSQYATIDYVNDQDDFKVSKSGDVMTGALTLEGDSTRIYMKDSNGDNGVTIWPTGQMTIKKYLRIDVPVNENSLIFRAGGENVMKMYPSSDSNLQFTAYKEQSITIGSYENNTLKNGIEFKDGQVTITNCVSPTQDHMPVTRGYLNDNKFTPGDRVAKDGGSTGTEVGGFYISGSRLYVRIS